MRCNLLGRKETSMNRRQHQEVSVGLWQIFFFWKIEVMRDFVLPKGAKFIFAAFLLWQRCHCSNRSNQTVFPSGIVEGTTSGNDHHVLILDIDGSPFAIRQRP